MDAAGAVSISAKDTSVVDALSFGVSGTGGVAVGVAISTNVIANTIETAVSGSTLDATAGGIDLTSESSAVIRALAIGVSGSGGVAVQVTAMGNAIANTVKARITGSTVNAAGDVSLLAQDIAPSLIPTWIVPADQAATLNENLDGSPVDLTGNILAVMVSVAGTGGVAVNGALSGNAITNTVLTEIDGSTIHTAGGADTVKTFNPAGVVSIANDTIDLGAGHGLQTGDAVVYDSGAGRPSAASRTARPISSSRLQATQQGETGGQRGRRL